MADKERIKQLEKQLENSCHLECKMLEDGFGSMWPEYFVLDGKIHRQEIVRPGKVQGFDFTVDELLAEHGKNVLEEAIEYFQEHDDIKCQWIISSLKGLRDAQMIGEPNGKKET